MNFPLYIRNSVFRNLFINTFLVILGYALAILTDYSSVDAMRVLKLSFLTYSLIHILIKFKGRINLKWQTTLLLFLVLTSCFVSNDVYFSLNKAFSFLLPFFYVNMAINYLVRRFRVNTILNNLNIITFITYSLPIFSFLIVGDLSSNNIYGQSDQGEFNFVSNHYGWSSCIILLLAVEFYMKKDMKRFTKTLSLILMVISFIIVIISGTRSAWISILLAGFIFVIRNNYKFSIKKIILILIPIIGITYYLQDNSSALNQRFTKTQIQLKEGNDRSRIAEKAFKSTTKENSRILFGSGIFNYDYIVGENRRLSSFHNSYYEILFGTGIFCFTLFLYMIVLKPTYTYIKRFSLYHYLFPCLLIIPFFESNLTGGQFLFFPWFTYSLLFFKI